MLRYLPALALVVALPAWGQNLTFGGMRADTAAPVEIAADALAVNQSDGTAVFTGNVVIGQGPMRLSARRVDVTYAEGGTSRIRLLRAEGDVTLVSGEDAAEAQEALYDVEAGQVTLIGDVILAQGGNVLTGQRMEVDLATGAARVEGRVRTILQPGQQGGGN
ncbi:lipopolysaccharide transport periplasmic protein LptA [Paracoccus bogoriensis]|uniref:lipopolysaccharide transport periplasmic protein LptA n=1 Tax=Paracoccus bogoriensis TaxID=242065 RepID=UPI001CA5ADC7|nr:lipopolysaccharide transport periplasmic protein LptA [Paracoccus bogoriensis]MBW7055111.1 lipopolysaccharide transport periplasmic protein LptA [Paracoccus bogoriensis]